MTFCLSILYVQGYEDVLRELGYTEQNKASFDFLTYLKQPDLEKVSVVTADLLILQKELSQFCNNVHINRERFLKYFSSSQVKNLTGGLHSTAKEGIAPQQHNYQHEKGNFKNSKIQNSFSKRQTNTMLCHFPNVIRKPKGSAVVFRTG